MPALLQYRESRARITRVYTTFKIGTVYTIQCSPSKNLTSARSSCRLFVHYFTFNFFRVGGGTGTFAASIYHVPVSPVHLIFFLLLFRRRLSLSLPVPFLFLCLALLYRFRWHVSPGGCLDGNYLPCLATTMCCSSKYFEL